MQIEGCAVFLDGLTELSNSFAVFSLNLKNLSRQLIDAKRRRCFFKHLEYHIVPGFHVQPPRLVENVGIVREQGRQGLKHSEGLGKAQRREVALRQRQPAETSKLASASPAKCLFQFGASSVAAARRGAG